LKSKQRAALLKKSEKNVSKFVQKWLEKAKNANNNKSRFIIKKAKRNERGSHVLYISWLWNNVAVYTGRCEVQHCEVQR